ncbi:unnamed protein product [Cercospora beticola]|nr:unnamed protein product [Cercospora beticola]
MFTTYILMANLAMLGLASQNLRRQTDSESCLGSRLPFCCISNSDSDQQYCYQIPADGLCAEESNLRCCSLKFPTAAHSVAPISDADQGIEFQCEIP